MEVTKRISITLEDTERQHLRTLLDFSRQHIERNTKASRALTATELGLIGEGELNRNATFLQTMFDVL